MQDSQEKDSMSRRRFVAGIPSVAAALAVGGPAFARAENVGGLTAGEVHEYLKSLDGGWVNWEKSVDTFKSGSAATGVKGIAVGWMPYAADLKKAVDLGCNLFVTHEPTYYSDLEDKDPRMVSFPAAKSKRNFVEENRLVIIRCHDAWDRYPKLGIPTAWGKLLDLGEPIEGAGFYYVYDGKGRPSGAIARQIAARTAGLGQPAVLLVGPEDKPVNRIALGCGAIAPMLHFIEKLQADMAICADDGFTFWRDGAYAIDAGFPVAVVNHPVSEENGVKFLAGLLREKFSNVPVHHIPQRCMYKLVMGG